MSISHTLSTCKHYVYSSLIALAMTLFLAGCPSPNDPAPNNGSPTVSIAVDRKSISEVAGSAMVTLTRSQDEVRDPLTVQLTIGGDATIDEDYALRGVTTNALGDAATVTIPGGDTKAMVTIEATDDSIHELDENLIITIDSATRDYSVLAGSVTVTINDDIDDLPTVGFRTTSQTLQEGDDDGVTVIVERSNDEVRDVLTVQLKIEGDVESVSDYETLSDTVTFKSGEDIATITLTAGDDGTKAEEQRVIITIETSDGYTVGDVNTATVTIIDPVVAGSPTISISASPSEVNEGKDITITVRSNIPVTEDLMVSFTIDDVTNSAQRDADYELDPESNTVTINDGSDSATITIRVHDDDDHEKNEDIQITISDSSSYYIKEGEKTVTVTITEDSTDLPTVSIESDVSIQEGNDAMLTLTRSNDEVRDVLTVKLSFDGTAEPDDYTGPTTARFEEGSDEVTITLTAEDDVIREAVETVVITISEVPSTYRIKDGEESATVTILNDDLPTVGFRTTSQTLQEGDDEGVTVILERSNDVVRDSLTVQLKIEGDVESVSDYETLSDTVTFKDGEDIATITLTAGDDGTKAEEERVIITIETSDAYTVGDVNTVTVNIIDPVVAGSPTISISADSAEVNEDAGEMITFIVSSDKPVTDNLMVSFTIDEVTNSAQQGGDYKLDPESNTVTINDGKKSATITLTVYEDEIREEDESVMISINLSPLYDIKDSEGSATLTIIDDDLPTVGFRTTSQRLDEGDGESVTVTVERSNDEVRDPLIVQLSFDGTAEPDDYTGLTTTARFEKDSDEVTITLTAEENDIHEGEETVVITIIDSDTYTVGDSRTATVTITDDDLPTVSIGSDVSIQEGNDATLTLTRSNDEVRDPLTVKLSFEGTAGSDDYTVSTTIASFGEGSDEVTITLTAEENDIHEGAKTVVITIIDSDTYTVGDSRTATVTITEDSTDLPTVSIGSDTPISEGGQATLTLTRSNDEVGDQLTVKLSFTGTSKPDDYTGPTTASFGEGSDEVTITLAAVNDDIHEGAETVVITIIDSDTYTVGASSTATVTITADSTDLPTVSIGSDTSISEGGQATLTLTRSNDEVRDPLTVELSFEGTAKPDDYTGSTNARFEKDSDEVTITLTAEENDIHEGAKTVVITIIDSDTYTVGDSRTATVTITDDDLPTVSIGSDVSIQEGNDATLTLTRSNDEVRDPLTVQLSFDGTAEPDDYTGLTTTARFEKNSDKVTITLTAVNDDIHEGEETVVITIIDSDTYTVGDSRTATVTITDDDLPTVSIGSDVSIQEGNDATLTLTRSNDEVRDQLTVQLSFDGTAEPDDYTGLTTTARFEKDSDEVTITLTAEENDIHEGEETVVITIIDSDTYTVGDSRTATVTITDDDLPTVSIGSDVSIQEGNDATLTLTRSNDEVRDQLTVQLEIEGDVESVSDYETLSNTVIFNKGEDTATITLTAGDDGTKEEEARVIITIELSDAYTVGASSTATVTITDDDLPTVSIGSDVSIQEGNDATLTLTRSNDEVRDPLTVQLSFTGTAKPDDYTGSTNARFEKNSDKVTITLTAEENDIHEGEETVVITIIDSDTYTVGASSTATVTITDDDLPTVSIGSDVSIQEGGDATLTLTRSNDEVRDLLTVQLEIEGDAENGKDYTIVPANIMSGNTGTVTIPGGANEVTFTIDTIDDGFNETDESLIITINVSSDYELADGSRTVTVTIENDSDVDDDNNGLIEIRNLDMLRNVHFNLAGTSYNDEDSVGNTGDMTGCPSDVCKGYELTRNLDFNVAGSYATGTINDAWRPNNANNPNDATNAGFPGIGAATGNIDDSGGFTGIFDGNGYTITNLYMKNTEDTGQHVGLFRRTAEAQIRNLGVIDAKIYGADHKGDNVGSLVGFNNGTIIASYASSGDIYGGRGANDAVGVLVGSNYNIIIASYAAGSAKGQSGSEDYVGGLVGTNGTTGRIIASYATGDVKGGGGDLDNVGGLVGLNEFGHITASYADTTVGGGSGSGDLVGLLVGQNTLGIVTESYGFGTVGDGETVSSHGASPMDANSAFELTSTNAGTEWNDVDSNTLGAWDFGTSSQNPALKYADYDGTSGDTYSCGPVPACGSFLPGQRD